MTKLAEEIMKLAVDGLDATQILSRDVGKSESEVNFIIEQLKVNGYLSE